MHSESEDDEDDDDEELLREYERIKEQREKDELLKVSHMLFSARKSTNNQ